MITILPKTQEEQKICTNKQAEERSERFKEKYDSSSSSMNLYLFQP